MNLTIGTVLDIEVRMTFSRFFDDLNIFLVDNDLISMELYRQYLLNAGYTNMSLLSNAEQCIQELEKKPDVILLDHKATLPDSLETIKAIKRHNPDIYLVYMLRNESRRDAIPALQHGAFDFVIKGDIFEEEMITGVMKRISSARAQIGASVSR